MKNRNIKSTVLIALFSILSYTANAQNKALKVGTNPTIKEGSAAFEVESADKGLLVPRVALISTVDVTTIASPANALTVFNTATSAAGSNSVIPGYYYYSKNLITPANSKWIKLFDANTPKSGWDLTGNTDTTAGTNFIGTTDNNDFVVKTNNIERERTFATAQAFVNSSNVIKVISGGDAEINGVTVGLGGGNKDSNTAVGPAALIANSTGWGNVAVGLRALYANKTGTTNTAVGIDVLRKNIDGEANTGLGSTALYENKSGKQNTGIGYSSLFSVSTGAFNTALGLYSGGSFSSGSSNTAVGYLAGSNNSIGSNNIALGNSTDFPDSSGSNQMNIGNVIFGIGMTGTAYTPAGNIGIGVVAPSNTFHVFATANPVRFEGLQASAITTDNVVVTDATGVLKTVTSASLKGGDYSATEQLTGKFWIDGTTPVYWKSIAYTLPANSTTFDISSSFTANQLKRVLSIRVINLTNNGISTEIGSYDLATNKFVMGSGNSFFNKHDAGNYEIIIEYLK